MSSKTTFLNPSHIHLQRKFFETVLNNQTKPLKDYSDSIKINSSLLRATITPKQCLYCTSQLFNFQKIVIQFFHTVM